MIKSFFWNCACSVYKSKVNESLKFTCPVPVELAASVYPAVFDPRSHWTVGERPKSSE